MDWTASEEAVIRQQISTRKYEDIASSLGRSVSSVCRKVMRMRASGGLPPLRRGRIRDVISRGAPRKDNDPYFEAITALDALEAVIHGSSLKSIHDIDEKSCRFVIGSPSASACFCPNHAGPNSPYCSDHHRRVFMSVGSAVKTYRPEKAEKELVAA